MLRSAGSRTLVALLALAVQGGATSGCAGDLPPEPEAVRDPFIALATDFEGFRDWPSIEVEGVDVTGGHGGGTLRVYLGGDLPEDPAAPFGVGARVVKSTEVGPPTEWEIHAMVKRGGGFNAEGSVDWEWFDLALDASERVVILWRGEGTAADPGGYGADLGPMGCNACHIFAGARDHVFTRPLLQDAGL